MRPRRFRLHPAVPSSSAFKGFRFQARSPGGTAVLCPSAARAWRAGRSRDRPRPRLTSCNRRAYARRFADTHPDPTERETRFALRELSRRIEFLNDQNRRQPATTSFRSRVRETLRRVPAAGIVGQNHSPSPQPWRRSTRQQRSVHDRVGPHALRPAHPRLRRAAHR